MKKSILQHFYHAWFLEPLQWIFYCFFQPDYFRSMSNSISISGYFWQLDSSMRWRRLFPTLKLLFPVYLCASAIAIPLWLLLWLVLRNFWSVVMAISPLEVPDTLLYMELHLVLPLVLLTFLGGIGLSLARGITLGITWGFILPFNPLFTPTEAILDFAIFGAIVFGTAFLCADIIGDILSSILWSLSVLLFWLGECVVGWVSWSPTELLSSIKMVVILVVMSGLAWYLLRHEIMHSEQFSTRKAATFGVVQSAAPIVWLIIWGLIPFKISLFHMVSLLVIGASYAAVLYIGNNFGIGLGVVVFFFLAYVIGAARLLLYPIDSCSMLLAYLKSKRHPEHALLYLQQSMLYQDECIFLPLPALRQILSLASPKNEQITSALLKIRVSRQIKSIEAPLQEFLLRYLAEKNNIPVIAEVHNFLYTLLPINEEKVGSDLHRPGVEQLVPEKIPFVDFQFAKPFIPFYDASQKIFLFYKKEWTLHGKLRRLEEAEADLKGVFLQKKALTQNQKVYLERMAEQWLSIIHEEKIRIERPYEEKMRIGQQIELRGNLPNPYHPGKTSIDANELFVGRLDLAFRLEQALEVCAERTPLLLYGIRRMGKTSILMRLSDLLSTRYVPIFYNLQDPSLSSDEVILLYYIAKRIHSAIEVKNIQVENPNILHEDMSIRKSRSEMYGVFQLWLEQVQQNLAKSDYTLLLAFDEFEMLEELARKSRLDLHLFITSLHTVMRANSHIALLFCGTHTQNELRAVWTDFFTQEQVLKVSFLHPTEAHELVMKANSAVPNQPEIFDRWVADNIIRETACHPYLVQALCASLIGILNEEKQLQADVSDIGRAVERVIDQFGHYFEFLWQQANAYERACLIALKKSNHCTLTDIAHRANMNEQVIRQALETLCRQDIVVSGRTTYGITMPIFQRWMERKGRDLTPF